jgi:glycerophosphoryl diester phosphodiesterase
VDLKPDDRRIAPAVLEVVRAHEAEDRVTVGSFHGPLVRHLRKLGYRGPTALTRMEVALLRALPAVVVRPAIRGRAAMIPRRHGRIRLDTGRFIRRCRALGLRVDFWVINEPSVARTLLDEGATGFVSDDPGALRHVISSAGGR